MTGLSACTSDYEMPIVREEFIASHAELLITGKKATVVIILVGSTWQPGGMSKTVQPVAVGATDLKKATK